MNLTDPEVRVLLWHIRVVEAAFGNEAPHQSTIDKAKCKLLEELESDES